MKSKKIVALALTAAMAISMASMTAFAADETWADYKQFIKESEAAEKDATEAFAFAYKQDGKDVKYFVFLTGTLPDAHDENGKTYTHMLISDTQTDKEGATPAELTFGQLKGLEAPANDPESDFKFIGWSKVNTYAKPVKGTSGSFVAKDVDAKTVTLQSGDSVIDGDKGTTKDKALVLYPVFQEKNSEDKKKDYDEISARPKIAKKSDEDDWKYTKEEIEGHTFGKKGEAAGAKEDCEKCNTTMAKSAVYDVKPCLKGTTTPVELRKSQKPKVTVLLPLTNLPAPDGYNAGDMNNEEKLKEMLKNGKIKVFHIGSDNKSHPVSGLSIKKDDKGTVATDDDVWCVSFDYGTFSDFVVTTDANAKAQAGEEESASGGNPATGEASALPVAMLALAALSATGVVAYKKRKAE